MDEEGYEGFEGVFEDIWDYITVFYLHVHVFILLILSRIFSGDLCVVVFTSK